MTDFIKKLESNENLSFEESKTLFLNIMEGKYDEISIIKILESLSSKGETKDELAGGIFVMRSKATAVKAPIGTIDTCGTGGDGQNSLNISTAAAIVLASLGVKVAKHGNKAVSSNCGSADVLEALKIKINLIPSEAEKSIDKVNFAFMFAPNYHQAMKYVAAARKKIAKKTIFNLIKVENAMIVHSEDGMDEISPFAKTKIIQLDNNKIGNFIIDPNDLNILNKNKNNLKGKNAEYNAQQIINIYRGEDNEFSDAVALNAAAGLVVVKKEKDFKNSYNSAKQHLKSGKVFDHLQKIQAI